MIQFDSYIFQMGWFHHQLENLWILLYFFVSFHVQTCPGSYPIGEKPKRIETGYTYPDAPCMEYLPTFTIGLSQM